MKTVKKAGKRPKLNYPTPLFLLLLPFIALYRTKGVGLCWDECGNDCRSVWSSGEVVRNRECGA
nr:hypothetical protein [Tanacetum cinerariifolium]